MVRQISCLNSFKLGYPPASWRSDSGARDLSRRHAIASTIDRGNKSVTPARKRLDKAPVLRRIAEYLANLVNGGVSVVIDIDKGVRPQPLLQFFPSHRFARALQQYDQDLEGLAAEFQFHTGLT